MGVRFGFGFTSCWVVTQLCCRTFYSFFALRDVTADVQLVVILRTCISWLVTGIRVLWNGWHGMAVHYQAYFLFCSFHPRIYQTRSRNIRKTILKLYQVNKLIRFAPWNIIFSSKTCAKTLGRHPLLGMFSLGWPPGIFDSCSPCLSVWVRQELCDKI